MSYAIINEDGSVTTNVEKLQPTPAVDVPSYSPDSACGRAEAAASPVIPTSETQPA